jgi:hypothetical protein
VLPRDDELRTELQRPEHLAKLFEAALCQSASDCLVAAECFRVIEAVVADAPAEEIGDVVASYAAQYDLAARPIDCATAFAARVFTGSAPSLVLQLFASPANTFLNDAVLDAFKGLPAEDQRRLAEELELPQKIIAAFDAAQLNGHVTLLAKLFVEAEGPPFDTPGWSDFVGGRLRERLANREKKGVPEPTAEESEPEPGALGTENGHYQLDSSSSSESQSDSDDEDPSKPPARPIAILESPLSDSYSSSSDPDDENALALRDLSATHPVAAPAGIGSRTQQIRFSSSEEDGGEGGDHQDDRPPEDAGFTQDLDEFSSFSSEAQVAPTSDLFDDLDDSGEDARESSDGEDGGASAPKDPEPAGAEDGGATKETIVEVVEESGSLAADAGDGSRS